MLKLFLSASIISLSAANAMISDDDDSPSSSDSSTQTNTAALSSPKVSVGREGASSKDQRGLSKTTHSGTSSSTSQSTGRGTDSVDAPPESNRKEYVEWLQKRIESLDEKISTLETKGMKLFFDVTHPEGQIELMMERSALEKKIRTWEAKEAAIRASHGHRSKKAKDLDYVFTRIMDLNEQVARIQRKNPSIETLLVKAKKQTLPIVEEMRSLNVERESLAAKLTPLIRDDLALKLPPAFLDQLAKVAFSFKGKGVVTEEELKVVDVFRELMEGYPPCRQRFMDTFNWTGATLGCLRKPQDMTNVDFEQDGLTREEYAHFHEGTGVAYQVHVDRMKQKLHDEAVKAGKTVSSERLENEARYQVWKKNVFQESYDAYKKAVQQLKSADVQTKDLGRFEASLTVLPPSDLWDRFEGLEEVSLSATAVSDLSPLRRLVTLKELICAETLVHDLSPLSQLVNLEWLDLKNTLVEKLSPLGGLLKLKTLILEKTKVKDISSLGSLANMEWLFLTGTPVEDISSLSKLKKLNRLFLDGTKVRNISSLSKLDQLRWIHLWKSQIDDLSALRNLKPQSLSPNDMPNLWKQLPGERTQGAQARITQNWAILEELKEKGWDLMGVRF